MLDPVSFNPYLSTMINILNKRLSRFFYSRIQWPIRRRSKPKIVIKRLGHSSSLPKSETRIQGFVDESSILDEEKPRLSVKSVYEKPIRVATFNAALFSMAPALPKTGRGSSLDFDVVDVDLKAKSTNGRPKSILKQSPLHPNSMNGSTENLSKQQKFVKSKLRVSINLPDNEISLLRSRQSSFREEGGKGGSSSINRVVKGKAPLRNTASFSAVAGNGLLSGESFRSSRTILEVLKEVDADILALQDVKAEEEKGMKPLSDLAAALGMNYVFAESWAPEYGNAVLSRWPIKKWKVQKIFDDSDFRNVLKATIDVPKTGEVNFHCTHLDHLDENWRMKQIDAIIQSSDGPHVLAGGLNSLDQTDYSTERWTDIVKYYEEIGKPTPKAEVMSFLKTKQYVDAKDYAGEYEPVVMIAKGQSVQGTCRYGTRLDYIMTSPGSSYKFVPGSYSVLSSKGTSDHHIVRVDIVKAAQVTEEKLTRKRRQQPNKRVVKISNDSPHKGIWKIHR